MIAWQHLLERLTLLLTETVQVPLSAAESPGTPAHDEGNTSGSAERAQGTLNTLRREAASLAAAREETLNFLSSKLTTGDFLSIVPLAGDVSSHITHIEAALEAEQLRDLNNGLLSTLANV